MICSSYDMLPPPKKIINIYIYTNHILWPYKLPGLHLGRFDWQAPEERALIKLRPKWLDLREGKEPKAKGAKTGVLDLNDLSLSLDLESGAEYGYFTASLHPKTMWREGIRLRWVLETT